MKDLRKNKPEYKPRLQPSKPVPPIPRDPNATGEVEITDKELYEKELANNALNELMGKEGEDPRTPPALVNKKKDPAEIKKVLELGKTTGTVDLMNPPFDPDIPEQKQRHFR